MLFSTYFCEAYAQARQKEFRETARLERLLRELEAGKPRLWQKWAWQVGGWMIVLGQKLTVEQRLTSPPHTCAER